MAGWKRFWVGRTGQGAVWDFWCLCRLREGETGQGSTERWQLTVEVIKALLHAVNQTICTWVGEETEYEDGDSAPHRERSLLLTREARESKTRMRNSESGCRLNSGG